MRDWPLEVSQSCHRKLTLIYVRWSLWHFLYTRLGLRRLWGRAPLWLSDVRPFVYQQSKKYCGWILYPVVLAAVELTINFDDQSRNSVALSARDSVLCNFPAKTSGCTWFRAPFIHSFVHYVVIKPGHVQPCTAHLRIISKRALALHSSLLQILRDFSGIYWSAFTDRNLSYVFERIMPVERVCISAISEHRRVRTPTIRAHYCGDVHSEMYNWEHLQASKPIMEKRRRARINNSLTELKSLILDATRKDVSLL